MDRTILSAHHRVNRAIIACRGIYAAWAGAHGIGYHRMLVLYTIRELGYCTQKGMCDSYLLPRQTMHNVICAMREEGLLEQSAEHSRGREKAFVLTAAGKDYAAVFLADIGKMEERAAKNFGEENFDKLIDLMTRYDEALFSALEAENHGKSDEK